MKGKPFKELVREIKRWHVQENGWSDIGYHYLISRDGQVRKGRPVEKAGAHTRGHNSDSIGVCLIGGHGGAKTDDFFDHFTQAQWDTLHKWLNDMETKYTFTIHGHNEYASKGCPSFDVQKQIVSIRNKKTRMPEWLRRIFG